MARENKTFRDPKIAAIEAEIAQAVPSNGAPAVDESQGFANKIAEIESSKEELVASFHEMAVEMQKELDAKKEVLDEKIATYDTQITELTGVLKYLAGDL
tara:strand:+ start:152 stop:451 length:300 start_codon:yes stop_codon:yes gene_type:complete